MILVNTSFYIHPCHEDDFKAWVDTHYLPAVNQAGFTDSCLSIILTDVGDEIVPYALQFKASTLEAAERWMETEGERLRNEFMGSRGEQALCFHTYMEIVTPNA